MDTGTLYGAANAARTQSRTTVTGQRRRSPAGAWIHRYPLLLVPVIVAVDALLRGAGGLPLHGLADEVSHVITAAIWLLAARSLGLDLHVVPGVIAAVLIDIDHVPDILGLASPPEGTSRPVTHALWIVLVVLACAMIARKHRASGVGIAVGLLSHLARDLATGTVLLWWPLADQRVSMPYATYILFTAALAALASSHFLKPVELSRRTSIPNSPPMARSQNPGQPFVSEHQRHDGL